MITVGVSGAPGKMGRLAITAIGQRSDLVVTALYAPGHAGEDILGFFCSEDPSVLEGCDVVIELTNPDVAPSNVSRWLAQGSNVVIGTSGYTEERIAFLRTEWAESDQRCLVVPNFSIGAVLMMRFAEQAAPYFESAEIIEMHHHDKPDAPSGTALNTAARMNAARTEHDIAPHSRGSEIVDGALGADVGGIPIHSLRTHGSVAHQEVVLGGVGQYLTIRHDTTDYEAFAPGILLALKSVMGRVAPVTVGLESVLGL
jgi:4-hydroxy-tetrahydrodipicolinate reductase